jgi:Pyruvate/2-oxoacid:ferredoxin oxidoreductase delta subunit
VGLVGDKLKELSKKTGVEKGRLRQVLQAMADKGTIWIDPREEDPTYRALGIAGPGIEGTPFFAGLKNADTVPMAKLKNKWKYQWIKHGMGSMGFPLAPVWACEAALPDDTPSSENVVELIRQNDYWALSPCACRFCHWVDDPGHHCRHLLETCLHMGDIGRYLVEHGMAREITCDEAIEILRKAHEDGLVTTCYPERVICNCCRDCCPFFIAQNEMNITLLRRSNFIAQSDEEACNACKTCAQYCPVGAIEVDESAGVDSDICIGCGVCVLKCKTESMRLVRRPAAVEVTEVGQTA